MTLVISNAIMFTIIGVNFLLRLSIIWFVEWVGYDTHSEKSWRITNAVLFCIFFNSGILLLLTNANLSEVSSLLGKTFSHSYYDYSPRWYATVGHTLVNTMLLNAFMPPIFEIITNLKVWLF